MTSNAPGQRQARVVRPCMWRSAAASLGVACACTQAFADEQPSVTPYRPSVSTPAALSAPGWLEIEAGGLVSRGSGAARRDSLGYTFKLAFTEDWGLRVGGDARARQTDEAGARAQGSGDASVVLKRRMAIDEASAFGVEAGVTLPTGSKGIGSAESDYSLNTIYSADFGGYHADLNLLATRFGARDPGLARVQTLGAVALSRSINDRWGLVMELSGTRQRGAPGTAQLLVAGSFNAAKTLTLDAGVARTVRPGATGWSVFAGLTLLGPRLF